MKTLDDCLIRKLIESAYKGRIKVETKDWYWKLRISISGLCQCCMQLTCCMQGNCGKQVFRKNTKAWKNAGEENESL